MTAAVANGVAPPPLLPAGPKCAGWLRAVVRGCAAGVLLALAANGAYTLLGCNFHTILPGQFYRCAQPSPQELERWVERYGIRTVVNLRGCGEQFLWYREECRGTHRLQLSQEDINFSATRLPAVQEMRRLVEVLDHSERPVLLHCRRGADRTGLASAVILLLYSDADLGRARRELGLRYGHLALGKTGQLNRFLDLYQEWLGRQGREHEPAAFRLWAREGYCPAECRCAIELLTPLAPIRAGRPFGLAVRVRNTSIGPWQLRRGTNAGFHAVYSLYQLGVGSHGPWRAGLYDAEVPPGATVDLTLVLPAMQPGRYRLLVDMTDEQHCWFMQAGSEPLEQEFEVREQEAAARGRPGPAGLARLADRLAPGR